MASPTETAAVHIPASPTSVDPKAQDQDQDHLDQQGQDEDQQQVLKEARRQERAQLIEQLKVAHRMSTPRYQFQSHVSHLANRIARATYDPTEMPLYGLTECTFDELPAVELTTRIRESLPYAEAIIKKRWQNHGLWSEMSSETHLFFDKEPGLPGIESRWEHERDTQNYDRFKEYLDEYGQRYQYMYINHEIDNSVCKASRPYAMFMRHLEDERRILLGLSKTTHLSKPKDPKGRGAEAHRSIFSPIPELSVSGSDPLTLSDTVYKHRLTHHNNQLLEIRANLHDLWQCAVGKVDSASPPSTTIDVNAINTQVYEITRGIWEEIGIWDPRWGVFPGLKWLHEEPLEEYLKRRLEEDGFPEDDEEEKEEKGRKEEEMAHNRLPLSTICSMLGKRKSSSSSDEDSETTDANANDNGLSTIAEAEGEDDAGSEVQTATLFGQQVVKRRRIHE